MTDRQPTLGQSAPAARSAIRPSARTRWLTRGAVIGAAGTLLLMLNLTGCAERLFYVPTREATPPPPMLSGAGGGPAEAVWFVSADGTRLRGWFVPAKGRPSEEALTVVHIHGNAGSMRSHIAFSDHLPRAGFNLFIFDFRGYGESEGRPTSRGPLIEDAKAAVGAVRARPDVDGTKVALFGQSLGGGIAINVLAEDEELLGAALESPISSWRFAAATALGGESPSWFWRGLAALLIGDHLSPLEAVATIDRPILIVHGDGDRIVPVVHGRRLAEAGPTVELVEIAGGDHNTLQETHPQTVAQVHEFLKRLEAGGGRPASLP